jgi:hypothetical protein
VPLERLESPEIFYPLPLWICAGCLLVRQAIASPLNTVVAV